MLAIFLFIDAVILGLFCWMLWKSQALWAKIIAWIMTVAITLANCMMGYYVYTTYSAIQKMSVSSTDTKQGEYIDVFVLDNSVIHSLEDLQGRKVGILSNMSDEQKQLITNDLSAQNIEYELVPYDSSIKMMQDLKGAAIDAVILYQPYLAIIEDYAGFETLQSDIRSIYQLEVPASMATDPTNVDVTTTPFNVLISGIDSFGNISVSGRSDVNMILTVNPVSHEILMTSIPRDYFVEFACDGASGCLDGQKDKLTHTGLSGISVTEKTLEQLFGIDINYDVRVNFSSVINIIDELGGVDVNNVDDFTSGNYYYPQGVIHMDGAMALQFSRERYSFTDGDRERGRNQMRVVQAIIEKALSSAILKNYTGILNAVADSVQMNLTADDIADLVQMQLKDNASWSIYSYSVTGSDDQQLSPALGDLAYVMQPNMQTVQNATLNIQAVMQGEVPPYVNQ